MAHRLCRYPCDTFMEVLDTSIANIALPHIAGSFGASINESTWVLTSYLVSNGIVLPISAWLATRYGRKRYYMFCVALFAGSSFLCGSGADARDAGFLSRGAGNRRRGACSQASKSILADTFSPEQRGMAFSIYGDGGGAGAGDRPNSGRMDHGQLQLAVDFLYQRANQHCFPVSHISFRRGPAVSARGAAKAKKGGIDYIGLGLVALGIGCLQMVMDKGQELDWFGSHWITAGSPLRRHYFGLLGMLGMAASASHCGTASF